MKDVFRQILQLHKNLKLNHKTNTRSAVISLVYLIFSFFFHSCSFIQKPISDNSNFSLMVDYYPAFSVWCRLYLEKDNDSIRLSLDEIFPRRSLKYFKENEIRIVHGSDLFTTRRYNSLKNDTFLIQHKETVTISKEILKRFSKETSHFNLAHQKNLKKKNLLDGITVSFRYKSKSVEHHFYLRGPENYDKEILLVKALFNLGDSSFKTVNAIGSLGNLKMYFPHKIKVNKVSDYPTEYSVSIELSDRYDRSEYENFIDSLYTDKPIIIDFTKIENVGRLVSNDNFLNAIRCNNNIYLLVDCYDEGLAKFLGISIDRLSKNREILMNKIKGY